MIGTTATNHRVTERIGLRPGAATGPVRQRPGAPGGSAAETSRGVRPGAEEAWHRRAAGYHELRGAAQLLGRMIEQMGGAETSFVRGAYVDLEI